MNAHNEQQGYTAADMADQAAAAFERGMESVLAEQAAAVQEAVAWFTDDHLTDKSATTFDPVVAERWRNKGWPVTKLYAAPVTAAPEASYFEYLDRYNHSLRHAIHAMMAKLVFLLDEDQFANIEAIALAAGVTPGAPGIDLRQPVAYLDLGAGGYVDVGSSLSDEQLAELPKGRHMLGIIGTYGVDGYVPADSPKGGSDARDAARWRYVRRKLCLTGNGDGTCGMQAINLPGSIPGWPDTSYDVVGFCEAAIDAAMQASDVEVSND